MTQTQTLRHIVINRRESGIAIVLLDANGAKLNTLSKDVTDELDHAVQMIKNDSSVKAVVFISGKADHFIFGADLFEIKKFSNDPESLYRLSRNGQRILDQFFGLDRPVVIAINGPCLGGGLELALAGHWRIATNDPSTKIGLPEVKLGILPGIGGTQRLPRLIGLKSALGFILSADPVSAEEARELGIVDEVVNRDELLAKAEARALALIKDGSPIEARLTEGQMVRTDLGDKKGIYRLNDLEDEKAKKLFAMTERSIRIKTRGNYPAQTTVVDVIKLGLFEGMKAGLEAEATAFGELASSEVSANLISLFFATDYAKQYASSLAAKVEGSKVETLAIVGGGLMGTTIAELAAAQGMNVILRVRPASAAATKERLGTKGIKCVTDDASLAEAQLVIEAVAEDLEVKKEVLAAIEKAVKPDCTIATNTSSFTLTELQGALKDSSRLIGLHFFNPVERMPLVEVVSQKQTDRKALARAADFVTRIGKTPAMVKDGPGFLINRLLVTYIQQAGWLVHRGTPVNWVDDAATEFGMPMGPFELLDESSHDLGLKVARRMGTMLGERMTAPALLGKLERVGASGKKTGVGVYFWDESGRKTGFNQDLLARCDAVEGEGKADKETSAQIAEELMLAMADEAARCLEEKIVTKPREVDMALVLGMGFPPFRGGVLKYVDKIGLPNVVTKLKEIYGKYESKREPSELLKKYAAEGRSFYSLSSE